MKSTRLDKAAELIVKAQQAFASCPPQYISGEALVLIEKAIEELREAQADLRVPSGERWELSWVKWYKPMSPKLYHRWDDAFKAAVLEMTILWTDFTVKMTKDDSEGNTLEWTIDARSQATLAVRKK